MEKYLESLPEWRDNARAISLFSSFPDKQLQPTQYETKYEFWKSLLLQTANMLPKPNLFLFEFKTTKDAMGKETEGCQWLIKAYERNGIQPKCLKTVLKELKERGALIEEKAFLQKSVEQPSGLGRFVLRTVQSGASWGWQQFQSVFQQQEDEMIEGKYLFLPLLQKETDEILNNFKQKDIDWILSFEEFEQLVPNLKSKQDYEYLLHYMHQQHFITVGNLALPPHEWIIRLDFKHAQLGYPIPLSDTEKSIYQLKKTLKELNHFQSQIEQKMSQVRLQIKQTPSRNTKLTHLKFYKHLESIQIQKLSQMHQLETIMLKIHDASQNVKVLETIQQSGQTLQSIMKESGWTVEKVEDVMDQVQDVMMDQKQLEEAMVLPVDPLEESELESELNALLEGEEDSKKKQKEAEEKKREQALMQELEQLQVELPDLKETIKHPGKISLPEQ